MRTDPLNLDIECRELMEQQRGFQLINPSEKWFPGLQAIREQFASWDWCIGKTPRFSVLKDVQLSEGANGGCAVGDSGDGSGGSDGSGAAGGQGAGRRAPLKLKVDVVAVSVCVKKQNERIIRY